MRAKIINILFIILCYLYYPLFKKRFVSDGVKKLLVVQTAKLGDMVCTTPMFRAIKKAHPDWRVFVAGDSLNGDLLQYNNDVDGYVVWNKKNPWENRRQIVGEGFDYAFVAGPNFVSLVALCLSGVPQITVPIVEGGWSPYQTRSFKILSNLVTRKPHRMGSYAPREYLKLLEPLGIYSEDTKKYVAFSAPASQKVDAFLLANGVDTSKNFIVGMSPSAGNKIKKWPAERFAELLEYVYKKYGVKIVVIGGKNDRVEVEEMVQLLDKRVDILNTCGLFSLDELKALISRMNIFVSVDTGPIYIAEALGVATIDIVGPMDEREQPPRGIYNKIVKVENRSAPELHIMNARIYNEEEALRQVNEITVPMVTEIFDALYESMEVARR